MEFPFRDFWSMLIVKFGNFTYLQWQVNLGAEDYGLKEWRIFKSEKVQQPSFYCDAFLYA
jgi:hypothetical protein